MAKSAHSSCVYSIATAVTAIENENDAAMCSYGCVELG